MSAFANRIYELLLKVPEGKVTTYKVLAEILETKAYRAVGQVLKNNPRAPRIPCHRVVNSNGKLGGFMGKKDGPAIKKKINLLKKEGITVKDGRVMRFEEVVWRGEDKE